MSEVVNMQFLLVVLYALAGYWRREFLGLAALTAGSGLLLAALGPLGPELYYFRPIIEVAAGMWLASRDTRLGLVLAATCAATLTAYALLQFDVVQGTDIIYSQYERVIYGIIAFRLAACANSVYQGVRLAHHDCDDGNPTAPGHRDRMA